MWKKTLTESFVALQNETKNMKKRLKKATKRHSETHDFRVFYKKLKSHISLFNSLGESHITLSEPLQEFYLQIWICRDAKIFHDLCKKWTHNNKTIMVFAEDRLNRAQEKLLDYTKWISFKKLSKKINILIAELVQSSQNFDPKWIQAWLESYFERTENLLNQLVHTQTVTDVGLHTIRKQIKKMLYLFPYLFVFNKKKYAPIHAVYKKHAQDLWSWNDYNLLVEELDRMPWKWAELKLLKKLQKKETTMKKEILHDLRHSFHVTTEQSMKDTVWKPTKNTPKKTTSPRKPGSSWSIKKPWNK